MTISVFLDSLKVRKKIHLGVQKTNRKFYLDILIQHKDIEVLIISNLLTVHSYLMLQFDNFYIVHNLGHKKFRSVENVKLLFKVSEIKALIFIYF